MAKAYENLSVNDLEDRYAACGDATLSRHFQAIWLSARGHIKHSERWLALPPIERKSLVREIVERTTVAADQIEFLLNRAKVAAALEAGGTNQQTDLDPIVVSIEGKLRRAGKGKRLVIENGAEAEVNAGLATMISRPGTSRCLDRTTASRR
jgi:hypothetical protein